MVNSDIKGLPALVFAIATLALVAGISVIILGEFQSEQETTVTVVNDSVDFTSQATYYYLANNATATSYWIQIINTSVTVQNATSGFALRAGNWTVDISLGRILANSGGVINNTWNVSYQYTTGTDARDIYGEGVTGILEITSWLDLIALITAVGIILYLVINVIGKNMGNNIGGNQGY